MPLRQHGAGLVEGLLELVYPERCVLCGVQRGEAPWCPAGPRVAGLRWFDRPHLCRTCGRVLAPRPVGVDAPDAALPVHAGRLTDGDLVAAVSACKYHGVRGLAWPLSGLLQAALVRAVAVSGPVDALVPVPLHPRRARARGFDQAGLLALLGGEAVGLPVAAAARRRRDTPQQARLEAGAARRRNVAGAFRATSPRGDRTAPRVGLVDDLVTGGATCGSLAATLEQAGWRVAWVACLGAAAGTGPS